VDVSAEQVIVDDEVLHLQDQVLTVRSAAP
jgi:hypothetical protein